MECMRPLKASFTSQGTITFSQKQALPGLVPFQLPCGKCLPCLLNRSREKGIRAWHEAKYHENSMFLTLTYSDEHLPGPKLKVSDSQLFIKRLRKYVDQPIGVVTTGEYGSKNHRPHWHYLIFGYRPNDCEKARETDFGDTFTSHIIDRLWESKGTHEIGNVTLDSASYVARYGAKALGQPGELKPHHRTGSKNALGKKWIQDNYKHTFENGFVVLPEGERGKIPRYYVDWAKQHAPSHWRNYVTNILPELCQNAELRQRKEELEFVTQLITFNGDPTLRPLTNHDLKYKILKTKFKELTKNLRL